MSKHKNKLILTVNSKTLEIKKVEIPKSKKLEEHNSNFFKSGTRQVEVFNKLSPVNKKEPHHVLSYRSRDEWFFSTHNVLMERYQIRRFFSECFENYEAPVFNVPTAYFSDSLTMEQRIAAYVMASRIIGNKFFASFYPCQISDEPHGTPEFLKALADIKEDCEKGALKHV